MIAFYQVDVPVQQSFLWYGSIEDSQVSSRCTLDLNIQIPLCCQLTFQLYTLSCSLRVPTFSALMGCNQMLFQDQ